MAKGAREVGFRLYLVTDRKQVGGGDLVSAVEDALKAGVRAVQLREKDLSARELFLMALRLRDVTARHGAKLLVNDRADVARAVNADGVHVPRNGMSVRVIRDLVGEDMLIGASTHSPAEVREVEAEGADFITLGPIYTTPSKAKYGPPIGLSPLEEASRDARVPIFAIGGIGRGQVAEVLSHGASGVALISGILAAEDVAGATRGILAEVAG